MSTYSRYYPKLQPTETATSGGYARYSPIVQTTPTPPPFVPTDIAGLKVWMDATDASTITQSAGLVTRAADKSGNGNDLVYPATDRPTYEVGTGINGLNRLVYTNNSGALWGGSTQEFIPANGFTAIFVLHGITPVSFPYLTNIISATALEELRIQVVPSVAGFNQLTASLINANTINIGLTDYYDNYYKTDHYLIVNYNGGTPNSVGSWTFTINAVTQTTATNTTALTSPQSANLHGGPQTITGAGFGPGGTQEEFLFYNRTLNGTEIAQLESYMFTKYALGSNPMFTPLDLSPAAWFRADSVSGTGSTVSGMADKSGNGLNGSLGAANATLLPTAINSHPALEFNGADNTMVFNGTNAMINKNTPFAIWGVCSTLDWYAASGGPGYYEFSSMSDGTGPSNFGLIFTTLDPAMFPGNTNWIIYVGDGIVPYVGGGATATLINQYFTFVINYNGAGDFGNTANFTAYFNGMSDTLSNSPAFADVSPPLTNAITTTGATNSDSAWAEYGIVSGSQITGSDLTSLLAYFNSRYGL